MLIKTPTSGELSLYVHLPFCTKKCHYCHFYVLPNKEEFKLKLKNALLKEIELKKESIKNKKIVSLYFGGGTPALFGPKHLSEIINSFKKYINLKDAEITLELNPENHSLELLQDYYNLGINRLSIGVQSFNDQHLENINRSHNSSDVLIAVENANKVGFENITIDLMYDLPNQLLKDFEGDLLKATQLPITHLSLYNLSIEKNTVFYKHKEHIRSLMPKASLSLKMYQKALNVLTSSGFNQYEISAFCKNQKYSIHNTGYWLQRNHLGFGPSAYSLIDKNRFQNISHFNKYLKQIEQNIIPIDENEKLDDTEFLKESLALHLRLIEGFDLDLFQERFGMLPKSYQGLENKLLKEKLIEKLGNKISLNSEGLLMHDSIASEIMSL